MAVKKLLTTDTVISTIEKVIETAEIELLKRIYPDSQLSKSHHLAYADWKVADVKSVPEFLHCGIKLKEGVFRFVKSDEPLYPPYKNREDLKFNYELSIDPFINKSEVAFE